MLAGAVANAQIPQQFTNLELLPTDIGRRELIETMRGFSEQLGVRCNHCHVGEDQTSAFSDYDFPADEKETKRVTRAMMSMTREINSRHLAGLGRETVSEVTCATCHHGQPIPSTLSQLLMTAFDEGGSDQLVATYGQLHGELYGRGVYDFGETALLGVASTLARQRKDLAAAEAVLTLNLEQYPDSFMNWYSMGELKSMSGDDAGALAAFQKALDIDPENEWARKAIEKLKK